MELDTQEWLTRIANIVGAHRQYMLQQPDPDLNYDEIGMDHLGSAFLFLYQTAVNDKLFEPEDLEQEMEVVPIADIDDEMRKTLVVAAGTCAMAIKQFKADPEKAGERAEELLQLARAYIYLYQYYYRAIDTKLPQSFN